MDHNDIRDSVLVLYNAHGPRKPMGIGSKNTREPHFFLVRKFLGDIDLAILFSTKRCRYQCRFCNLPAKSSRDFISGEEIEAQFAFAIQQAAESIGVLDRLTVANEGSVLDVDTFPAISLSKIAQSTSVLPALNRLVIETRLEFVESTRLLQLRELSGGKVIDVLTGFETVNERIRDEILGKRESLKVFLSGLDNVAAGAASLTAYVLYKPDPHMSDEAAFQEAERSVRFLAAECHARGVPLTIRLNPMYVSRGTPWEKDAKRVAYQPPSLSDVLSLTRTVSASGLPVYLGLTSEGLADDDMTYRAREDFSKALLRSAIVWNREQRTTKDAKRDDAFPIGE